MSEQTQTSALEASQAQATLILSRTVPVIALLAVLLIWIEAGNLLVAGIGGAVFGLLGLVAPRFSPVASRILVGQAMVGVAITLNAALAGHPMQIDSHMFYFAILAMLVPMSDLRPLLVAAGTIAVHHLVLTVAMPSLVYPSDDLFFNIGRTVFHAVIVVLETATLTFAIHNRIKLSALAEERQADAESAMKAAAEALEEANRERDNTAQALQKAQSSSNEAEQAQRTAEAALENAKEQSDIARAAEARDQEARAAREREVTRLLEVFRAKLAALAAGDLTVRITDDLGPDYRDLSNHFNEAAEKLSEAMNAVTGQAVSIQDQSREISNSANDLSTRTEHQAATLAELAASLDQLTNSIRAVAEDSGNARKLAEETSGEANDSTDIMNDAVVAMNQIENSSLEIQKITGVIDDIAFQTNLLALNAGVEAARAGEAGRGFAVVASEVRALAQRSSDAAREINTLINSSVNQVASGAKLVHQTGGALSNIQGSIDRITERLRSIAGATSDQSRGLSEVNTAISNLEGVTQRNAAMFEETTAANNLLFSSSQRLSQLVETFRIDGAHSPATDEGSAERLAS